MTVTVRAGFRTLGDLSFPHSPQEIETALTTSSFETSAIAGSPTTDGEGSFLQALRSHEDPRSGIRERFMTPALGGGRTVAVLSGLEQLNLQPLEVPLARWLAPSGDSVLRYHSQGYGEVRLIPAGNTSGMLLDLKLQPIVIEHLVDWMDETMPVAAEPQAGDDGLPKEPVPGAVERLQ